LKAGPYEVHSIKNNRAIGPEGRMQNLLNRIVAFRNLPNLNFIYFRQDNLPEPSGRQRFLAYLNRKIPVFVSAKRRHLSNQLLFADWHYDIDDLEKGWNGYVKYVRPIGESLLWHQRIPKLVWRGQPNDGFYTPENWEQHPRGHLVHLAREGVDGNIDAAFTGFHRWSISDISFFSKLCNAPQLPAREQSKFRYQIDLDGVTATFTGLGWKLLSGSLVFKQDSDKVMWFHPLLKPWEHFIPVERNLTDFKEKLNWARDHDSEAQRIAENGRQIAISHLMPEHIARYCHAALLRYASFQRR